MPSNQETIKRTRELRITLKAALTQEEANDVAMGDVPTILVAALRSHGQVLEAKLADAAAAPLSSEAAAEMCRTQRHLQTVLALTRDPVIGVRSDDSQDYE